ncbi:MAG: hypothetical protein IJL09_03975 [Lachnospiraceae bacterium]|nr:hypothetical protein [Lachnospiraceae bacterium]
MKPIQKDALKEHSIQIETAVFIVALMLVGFLYLLFYKHYVPYGFDEKYHTIFAEKLFKQNLESMKAEDHDIPIWAVTYPFYHVSLKAFAFLLGNKFFEATYLLNALCVVLAILLIRVFLLRIYPTKEWKKRALYDMISVCAVVFVTASGPLNGWRMYARQSAANPVHNPTVLFVRPFSILVVLAFLLFLERFDKKEPCAGNVVLFGLLSFFSVLAKPNFAFVFLPAMGIVILEKMIRDGSIRIGIMAFLAVLPSLILMLWQFCFITDDTVAIKVHFSFGSFSEFTPLEVVVVSLVTFPVPIILASKKLFVSDVTYRLAIYALVIGWFQMFFLTNGPSGDFTWGYDLAIQFATVVALVSAFKAKLPQWRWTLAFMALVYQVVCGLSYLSTVYRTLEIWI